MEVNAQEAQTHLSRLLKRVVLGEEVTITRAGKPIAKLVPICPPVPVFKPGRKRPLGMDRGKIWVSEDFNALIPELEALFYDTPFTTDEDIPQKGKTK